MDEEYTISDLLKELLPYLILTGIATFLAVVLFMRFGMPLLSGTSFGQPPAIATFDVIRYTNAQRAVAAAFLRKDTADQAQAAELLNQLPDRTRAAIEEIAGPGTLVVLKQSVIQGPAVDITEAVLKKLGLPDNVPTSDGAVYSLDVAPTMFMKPLPPRSPLKLPGEDNLGEGLLP